MSHGARSALVLGFAVLLVTAYRGVAAVPPAAAQDGARPVAPLADSALEAEAARIAAQLRCVVCQGLSIQDSPSELAREMKQLVRDQLREGRTAEEVKAYFLGRYGEFVLLEPEPRGFNLLVYVLPVVALLLGAWILVRAVRGWTRAVPEEFPHGQGADEAVGLAPDPFDTPR